MCVSCYLTASPSAKCRVQAITGTLIRKLALSHAQNNSWLTTTTDYFSTDAGDEIRRDTAIYARVQSHSLLVRQQKHAFLMERAVNYLHSLLHIHPSEMRGMLLMLIVEEPSQRGWGEVTLPVWLQLELDIFWPGIVTFGVEWCNGISVIWLVYTMGCNWTNWDYNTRCDTTNCSH